jgi:hypothetical protein
LRAPPALIDVTEDRHGLAALFSRGA